MGAEMIVAAEGSIRLYRGLDRKYRPEKVARPGLYGTDFTDCPFAALDFARGRHGVVLVLDVPPDASRITEELWPSVQARRLMVWGPFDRFIVAIVPAKELRAEVRKQGVASLSAAVKSDILRDVVAAKLKAAGREELHVPEGSAREPARAISRSLTPLLR